MRLPSYFPISKTLRKMPAILLSMALLAFAPAASAQEVRYESSGDASGVDNNGSNRSVLLTRQGQRLELLEEDLRGMRGVLETDLRNLKMQITQLSNNASTGETTTSAEMRDLRDQVERIADSVAMVNRRMERMLEMNSDMEFRLLRMEKRLQTLMSFGGDKLASSAVQDDTVAAGENGDVSMQRDTSTGETTWKMDEDAFNKQMNAGVSGQGGGTSGSGASDQNGQASQDGQASGGSTLLDQSADTAGNAPANTASDQTNTDLASSSALNGAGDSSAILGGDAPIVPPKPEVLPEGTPEEQYTFALGRAMQNDLETAEAAFTEFRQFNAGHTRQADALFWLGRIQFLREEFDLAAMTFSEFNKSYPDDARLVDTTLWIAESVSRFAPAEQACAIYASLPSLVETPPDRLMTRLAALSKAANCDG